MSGRRRAWGCSFRRRGCVAAGSTTSCQTRSVVYIRIVLVSLVLTLAAGLGPATSPDAREGTRTARLIAAHAETERRDRFVRGSVRLAIGSAGVAIGAYAYAALGASGPTVERAAVVQMLGGSGVVLESLISIARPGPLQVLASDPAVVRLRVGGAAFVDLE